MKTYKSAVDLWLALILIGVPLVPIFMGVSISLGLNYLQWHARLAWYVGLVFILAGVGIGAAIAFLSVPCRYTLREHDLYIQAGVLVWEIPYRKIRRLELSCSLWSAPALSLQRVKIVLDDGFCMVSPRDRTAFIEDLKARLPLSA